MNEPFVPEGAPRRPVGRQLWPFFFVGLMFGVLVVLGPHPVFKVVGLFAVLGLVAIGAWFWRHWNRTGWYEQQETVVPPLPFRVGLGIGENIIFKLEGIEFCHLLLRNRFIAYGDIRRVETMCRGIILEGVQIHLSDRNYHDVVHAPELIPQTESNGETTLVALAILRQMAPHANFIGPKWIEEGWVPRLGFALRQRGMPG